MKEARHEFGTVSWVKADAIGEPGKRQFRLLIDSPAGSACLWLEKEQLYALGIAIHQLLVAAEGPEETRHQEGAELASDPPSRIEFKVGSLALGHDPQGDLFAIMAQAPQEEEETFRCWATRQQVKELAEEAFRVCAAGRPLCPLCHGPMEPESHICPKGNGHHPVLKE